jgi:hypothetical protein
VWSYDEAAVLATCEKVRALYVEAGRQPDSQYPVWEARTVYDACAGMSYPSSEAKHLKECRIALGLPVPVDPNVRLPRLVVSGQMFALEDGTPFTVRECSDFNLLNRWQHGEDITPILEQRREAGFNMLRVWTLFNLPPGIGVFLDIDYSRIPDFLQLCANYGFYVEFTAYTSLERVEHWALLVNACQGQTNVLLELVNEGDLPVNKIDFTKYPRPSGVLACHGSAGGDTIPPWEPWDYCAFHTNGASEEQRKVGHNAMEISTGPVITNETSRFPDVGMWVGSDLKRCQQLAFDSAAGAALLCAGSCFHSVQGKNSTLWDANTFAAAEAWVEGANSINLAYQHAPYKRRDDLLVPGVLRVYQRGDSPVVTIRA